MLIETSEKVLTNFIDILSNQSNAAHSRSNSNEPSQQGMSNVTSENQPQSPQQREHQARKNKKFPSEEIDALISAALSLLKLLNSNKRALYIIAYASASFYLNEIPNLVKLEADEHQVQEIENDTRPLNIMSLGYLLLLTYDLANNFEQILLRILIQLKILGRLISQYGLNNFLSFNWFERLKVFS